MCQMPNICHICHTKHKKHLPSNVLYVPNFYHLCPYYCKFATVWTQMVNWKILFYLAFLSPLISLFDFVSPFLESVSLSQVPNPHSSSSHNRTRARRRWRRRRRRRQPIIVILHNHHLSQPQPSPQQQNPNPKKPNKPTTTPPYLNPQPPLATKLNQIHSNKTQILQQNLNPKNL